MGKTKGLLNLLYFPLSLHPSAAALWSLSFHLLPLSRFLPFVSRGPSVFPWEREKCADSGRARVVHGESDLTATTAAAALSPLAFGPFRLPRSQEFQTAEPTSAPVPFHPIPSCWHTTHLTSHKRYVAMDLPYRCRLAHVAAAWTEDGTAVRCTLCFVVKRLLR